MTLTLSRQQGGGKKSFRQKAKVWLRGGSRALRMQPLCGRAQDVRMRD